MRFSWSAVRTIVRTLDSLTEHVGKAISWFNVLLVSVVCLVVILRYLFNMGSIALQESAIYFHAIIFLGASGYTLKHDEHVRVDVFYRAMSARHQALVNCLGTLFFLIPVCLFIGLMSWEYILNSWIILETSQDPGGLPFIYLLKSLILTLAITLLLQGVAELLRSVLILLQKDREEISHG